MDVKGTMMFPKMNVEPSFLLDLSYQKDIQRLIKLYMQEDGEERVLNVLLIIGIVYGVCLIAIILIQQCTYFLFSVNLLLVGINYEQRTMHV
jgi:hypothetical protein